MWLPRIMSNKLVIHCRDRPDYLNILINRFINRYVSEIKKMIQCWHFEPLVMYICVKEFCHCISSWWRHQMETSSALLAICAGNSPVPGEFPHKGQWRGALTFSLICVWMKGWVNNREAGDLRRYCAHYDITVMSMLLPESMLTSGHLDPSEQISMEFKQNVETFLQQIAFYLVIYKNLPILFRLHCVNSLWPSDTIWQHRSG